MFRLVQIILYPVAMILLPWLAQESILFTSVREGTAKAIMRGHSFDRFIISFTGYHLNDPSKKWYDPALADWSVVWHGKGKDGDYDDRSWLLKHLGLYWVGWPWANSVYVYEFEWNETYTDLTTGKEKVLPRAEATDFIYVADFTYAIMTEESETKDRLPTDERTHITIAIRNPYRALFSGEDWMRRVTAAVNRHVRTFVGEKPFQILISTMDPKAFSGPIIDLNGVLPDDIIGKPPYGLRDRYGVEIRTADLQTIELSGDAKKQAQEATTQEYVAKQAAKAVVLKGTAEAKIIKLKGDKEAEALEARLKVIDAHGETGIKLAGYDAIQEASKNPGTQTIWANDPLGAVVGILKPNKTNGGKTS
ncbi:MAG: hypothetical protein G01um101491_447 [Parcubacteria group bacterium Gr01-1014_91]|nr:MAG: hypothetical protein G01um101491_447 [Parcubacteria group bacterium Gr01-1014_91]